MTSRNRCTQSFKALLVTQFLGSFSDLFLFLTSCQLLFQGKGTIRDLVFLLIFFFAPFLLFSVLAGSLGDRFPKRTVIRGAKSVELLIVLIGLLWIAQSNVYGLLLLLFFFGTRAALTLPCAYGMLPELLDDEHLSCGNGYLAFWCFVGLIAGAGAGGIVMTVSAPGSLTPGIILVTVAACGLVASYFLAHELSPDSSAGYQVSPLHMVATLAEIRNNNYRIFLTLLGVGFFWTYAAFCLLNLVIYIQSPLDLDSLSGALCFALLGLGAGLGSMVAGTASGGKVELGLIPIGLIGLVLFTLFLPFTDQSYWINLGLLFGLGFSGGFFLVPLHSFLQTHSPPDRRGRYIAVSNMLSSLGMLLAFSLLLLFAFVLSLGPSQVFFLMGMATLSVLVSLCVVLPDLLVRSVNWLLIVTIYQLRVVGRENVPQTGGALLVCNHVSYADAPLLLASLEQPVCFLMSRPIYDAFLIRPFARAMRAIPIQAGDKRERISEALAEARCRIEQGELVCIFAEGGITRTGQLLKFKKGLERIMDGLAAPIIPVHLDQMWGSVFSYRNGKFFWKMPRSLPYPVTISFGKPLPSSSTSFAVRLAVQELSTEAFKLRKNAFQLLHRGFIRSCKRIPFRPCIADSSGKSLSSYKALAEALAYAHCLESSIEAQSYVGVCLPPSVAAVLTNIALLIKGRVPVNLDFSGSKDAFRSALSKAEIRTVITTKRFLENESQAIFSNSGDGGSIPEIEMVTLEELAAKISMMRKFAYSLSALLMPRVLLEALFVSEQVSPDDVATVIFSDTRSGELEGVLLSHANISSNITGIHELFQTDKDDCILGVLPFCQAFGCTTTLWLPLFAGIKAVYHEDPSDVEAVGNFAEAQRATILLSTPTMLTEYQACSKKQFESLRHVLVGEGELEESLRTAFEERFAVSPREGYGHAELSPVTLVNIPDFSHESRTQVGSKPGTAGHPIPGVAVSIVDPGTHETVRPQDEGMLIVKGSNVMLGYLGNEEKTAEVIKEGWYLTGDRGYIDEDGFVTITQWKDAIRPR